VRALDSGAGENVMQWCLGGRRVRQKSPIEFEHAQKSTELTGGLGRVAVLEIGHFFFQRLGTLDGHVVTEECDLRCSKDTLRLVDADPYLRSWSKRARRCCTFCSSDREKIRMSSK
jgi:hypothetical protein